MKTKFFASIFAAFILLSLTFVSALITETKGPDFTKSSKESSFTIHANNNVSLTLSAPDLRINDGSNNFLTLSLNPSSINNQVLAQGSDLRINASVTIDPNFNFELKTYNFPAITITATDATNSTITENKTFSFNFINSFCEFGANSTALEITRLRDE